MDSRLKLASGVSEGETNVLAIIDDTGSVLMEGSVPFTATDMESLSNKYQYLYNKKNSIETVLIFHASIPKFILREACMKVNF